MSNQFDPVWKTKEGDSLEVSQMTTSHLLASKNMLESAPAIIVRGFDLNDAIDAQADHDNFEEYRELYLKAFDRELWFRRERPV